MLLCFHPPSADVFGAGVFLHLHGVLSPSRVRHCSLHKQLAAQWLLAGGGPDWGLVHPQQVSHPANTHYITGKLLTYNMESDDSDRVQMNFLSNC